MQSCIIYIIFLATILSISIFIPPSEAGIIAESLQNKLSTNDNQDVIVEFPSVMGSVLTHPSLSLFSEDESHPNKTDIFVNLLQISTTASQSPFLQSLKLFGASSQATPFWISNKIAIKDASPGLVSALSQTPGEFTIREPHAVKLYPVNQAKDSDSASIQADAIPWGVKKIGAPLVWAKITKGEGIVVANIDTGVNVKHEALMSNYRGGVGSWHDAINQDNTEPYDDNGHGTHTMGTICGTTKGIGVAPGAKWIACKALNSAGSGSETQLTGCAQWILKPNSDASLKPHIVSNSWGGDQNQAWFDDEITAWKTAGIIPIFAIGNDGSKCETANSPGDREGVISVGSTNLDDKMSYFSSRGKSLAGKMKPEVSAPGNNIVSAGYKSPSAYVTLSGTSMATPHVAGAAALLMASKTATNYNQILGKLKTTAARPAKKVTVADLKCGVKKGTRFPNNAYGFGRISVSKASGL